MHKKRNWRRKVTTTRSRSTAISSIQCGYSIRHGGHRISLYCIHVSLTCVWVRPTKCVLTEMRRRCPALMTSAQLDRAPENGQRLIYLITDEQIHSVQPLSAVQLMNPISQRVFTPAETCQLIKSIVYARYPASISVRQCSAKVIFSRRSRERPLRRSASQKEESTTAVWDPAFAWRLSRKPERFNSIQTNTSHIIEINMINVRKHTSQPLNVPSVPSNQGDA